MCHLTANDFSVFVCIILCAKLHRMTIQQPPSLSTSSVFIATFSLLLSFGSCEPHKKHKYRAKEGVGDCWSSKCVGVGALVDGVG